MSLPLNLYFADLIDITLVALFLYALLIWLQRSASPPAARRAYVLAIIFAGLYLLVSTFELYLVRKLIQTLLLVMLIAAVVVFQQELRRLLNRLGSWTPFRAPSASSPTSRIINDLVEAVDHLAEHRIGALIAIKGREPWAEYIQGGVTLRGELSQPLLYSLFAPETPGHDGAVLIENARVSKFAAHLPLARNLPEASRYGGTRHAAALGLSEQCDALVVVVSEERGVISVAEAGSLSELNSASELSERLERFWERGQRRDSRNERARPPVTALLSVSLAAILWLLFAYSPNTLYRTFDVPIEVRNVPGEWSPSEIDPSSALVTISGPERAFESLNREALTISLDLSSMEAGENRLGIDAGNIQLPPRLRLDDVNPRQVRVVAQQLVLTEVTVEVPTFGLLPAGLSLVRLQVQPERVPILVDANKPLPRRVLTEAVNLSEVAGSGTVERSLILLDEWRLPQGGRAEVDIVIEVQAD